MADQRFVRNYKALDQHRAEMRAAAQQRRRRLVAVTLIGIGATAVAYWLLPPLALLTAGVAVLTGFFATIPGASSVPAAQMTGAEGEARVLETLRELPDSFTIFNQVQIPDATLPSGRRELDFVIAAPGGLFIIEVKNSAGLIYVRPQETHWPLAHKAGCGGRPGWNAIANPLNQVRSQAAALDRWLLGNGQTAPIHAVLCFARSDVALQDREDSPIPVLTLPELTAHLAANAPSGQHSLSAQLLRLLHQQVGSPDAVMT